MLLAPERLRQLHGADWQAAHDELQKVAVGPATGPHFADLTAGWQAKASDLERELKVLGSDKPLPRTFPCAAERIAYRISTELLPAELAALATAVVEEPDPVPRGLQWAEPTRTELRGHGAKGTQPTAADLDRLLDGSADIGRQTITQEAEPGSDPLPHRLPRCGHAHRDRGVGEEAPGRHRGVQGAPRLRPTGLGPG